jgi:hypothetical protein
LKHPWRKSRYFPFGLTGLVLAFFIIIYFLSPFRVAVVEGVSMLPTLKPNDQILYFKTKHLAVGEIGVFKWPDDGGKKSMAIKRLSGLSKELSGMYFFVGDNALWSLDSKSIGLIPESSVVGKACLIIFPPQHIKKL